MSYSSFRNTKSNTFYNSTSPLNKNLVHKALVNSSLLSDRKGNKNSNEIKPRLRTP